MNVSSAIVLAVVIALVCLAIRSFRRKGMCGCKEHCSGGCASSCSSSSSSSCSCCSSADKMVADMKKATGEADKRV